MSCFDVERVATEGERIVNLVDWNTSVPRRVSQWPNTEENSGILSRLGALLTAQTTIIQARAGLVALQRDMMEAVKLRMENVITSSQFFFRKMVRVLEELVLPLENALWLGIVELIKMEMGSALRKLRCQIELILPQGIVL